MMFRGTKLNILLSKSTILFKIKQIFLQLHRISEYQIFLNMKIQLSIIQKTRGYT